MRNISAGYILQRFIVFIFTIWLGVTIIFFIPRVTPGDPVTAMVGRMIMRQGYVDNAEQIISTWKERFGLNASLIVQYGRYLKNLIRFEFGYSLAYFPITAMERIKPALPWTLGLLSCALVLSFIIGNTLGALMGWKKTPRWLQSVLPFSVTFSAIPYFMFGILLISIFAFQLKILPASGGYDRMMTPGFNLPFIVSVAKHGILPLLSIVLTSMGGRALGMRGLMIQVNNEDYFLLAQSKGLLPSRIFFSYGIRNTILPTLTSLAMSLGGLIGGSTLVEFIFAYPGTGYMLYQAISNQDYTVIQAICNIMVILSAGGVFLIDILAPMIDPRINFNKTE